MKRILCFFGIHSHYKKRTDCYTILHYCHRCNFVAWQTSYDANYSGSREGSASE